MVSFNTYNFLLVALVGVSFVQCNIEYDDIPTNVLVTTETAHCFDEARGAQCLTQVKAEGGKLTVNFSLNTTACDSECQTSKGYKYYQVKLCFSDKSIEERPWRKHKDEIKKDKQCKKSLKDDIEFTAEGGSLEYEFDDAQPGATYYVTVFTKNNDGDYLSYGTTLGSTGYFEIDPYQPVDDGLKTGAAIMSAISIVILIGCFVNEHQQKKE
ncbi:high-affinity nitrate transporter [Cymbomonas tetramitiformis]|uniref:High-affinity nitrate transporter n=1 Tax=Cymbomonas tetramitiformis TaxID=36881 RepID=A0AAE0GFC2_9CHLO|nr:high-affinity nitrate transporter [Cymbomonas tetramitiformis]